MALAKGSYKLLVRECGASVGQLAANPATISRSPAPPVSRLPLGYGTVRPAVEPLVRPVRQLSGSSSHHLPPQGRQGARQSEEIPNPVRTTRPVPQGSTRIPDQHALRQPPYLLPHHQPFRAHRETTLYQEFSNSFQPARPVPGPSTLISHRQQRRPRPATVSPCWRSIGLFLGLLLLTVVFLALFYAIYVACASVLPYIRSFGESLVSLWGRIREIFKA